MTDDHSVSFTRGSPETVLPAIEPEIQAALEAASGLPDDERRQAVAAVAAHHPRCLDAWADLAELGRDPVERYAYARVGYHRGLDALRASGWRGSGLVQWKNPTNRGFLRSLDHLAKEAAAIGESDEQQRCEIFLRQLDPQWVRDSPDRQPP